MAQREQMERYFFFIFFFFPVSKNVFQYWICNLLTILDRSYLIQTGTVMSYLSILVMTHIDFIIQL